MKIGLVLLVAGAFSAFAQTETPSVVVGAIQSTQGRDVEIRSGSQRLKLRVESQAVVWKNGGFRDLSRLNVGDEIAVRCRRSEGDVLVAAEIWADPITFSGTVSTVKDNCIEVAARERSRTACFSAETVFSTSRNDLETDREVHVVGLDVRDGTVQATRVTIYNTDVPVTQAPLRLH